MYYNGTKYNLELTEELFLRLGSSWTLDSIYLFVIPPLSVIGFFLNLSFFFGSIGLKDPTNLNIYKYLIIYSFNSSILCFMYAFTFLTFSPRYFDMSFCYATKFYRCKILAYFSIVLSFFGNMLDIMIALDRISTFLNEKMYGFNAARPLTKCLSAFILSLIINIPILYSLKIMENNEFFNENAVNFCGQTYFGRSNTGIVINLVLVLFRDILTLIIETILTGLSLFYYKKYKSKSIDKYYIIATKSFNLNIEKNKRTKGKELLFMSIYLSFISIVLHLIICSVMFMAGCVILKDFHKCSIFTLILIISIVSKNFLNVFVCYRFDSEFKKQFKLSNLFLNSKT